MSKQINFFAAPSDARVFHCWLSRHFPDMLVLPYDSACESAMQAELLTINAELLGKATVCLVPPWAQNRLLTRSMESRVSLDLFNSPVLEYSPSIVDQDSACVRVGRVYWAFNGKVSSNEKKQVNSVFRWLESQTELLPGYASWRIFPGARLFRSLRQWIGPPEPNPLYTDVQPAEPQ